MKKILSNKYYLLFARLVLGFVFVYAGAEKISNPESFALSILNYKLFPLWLINFNAIILPWIELTTGVFLIFGITVKENSMIIFTLLIIFNIAIIISLARGLNIDCGCFGNGTKIGLLKLTENFLMIFISYCLMIFGSDFFTIISNNKGSSEQKVK